MAKSSSPAKKPTPAPKTGKAAASAGGKNGKNGAKNNHKPAPKQPAKVEAKAKAKPVAEKPAAPKPVKKSGPDLSPKVLHLVSEEMAIEEAELTPEASFREDLGLDEIDIAELLMQAELAFGVSPFNEEDWESCETVADLVLLIEKRVAAKRGKKPGKA
ncbi:MAG TPA: acyl carrier protein [Terriglobales bacterium]|nr:acyl carrier protein [Terriglobales bacterium]